MTGNAKIEVSIGSTTFAGEGDQEWLAKQLDKVLAAFPVAVDKEPEIKETSQNRNASGSKQVGTLATYLRTKDATTNQTRRFLATAAWLAKKGNGSPKTSDVAKALKDNQQSRLGNPSDCLNKNVNKGFCEKSGDNFFVTPEGWAELGDEK